MEPQPPNADLLPWLVTKLGPLADHVVNLLIGLFSVEALWMVLGTLAITHLIKIIARRYGRAGLLDRSELYLINVGTGLGLAAAIWPMAHFVPWWIAGPCWGTVAHWAFRLFKIVMIWRYPKLYGRLNLDRRTARQKRPAHRERRRR